MVVVVVVVVVGLAKGDKNSPFPRCSCATSAAWFLLLCALCAHLICFLHAPLYAASELHSTTILPTGESGGGEATMTRGSCTNGKKAWPGMVVIVGRL